VHRIIRSYVGGRRAIKQRARCVAPAPRTVNLTTEQRFIIKEIVLKDLNVPKARAGAPESIGDPVPSNVELHDMTPELARKVPEAKSHQFYVTADAIVLVSRSDLSCVASLPAPLSPQRYHKPNPGRIGCEEYCCHLATSYFVG